MNEVYAVAADEYRKTIGKDAALERRFQPVTIEEPTVESTISILRGLKSRYEVRLYACPRHLLLTCRTGPSRS